jgi:ATP-binding cassette subfamily F protein 3
MINLENVGLFLPQGFLYQGVSFQINKGDRIGLVGKNGAGKSTMLRMICQHQAPSEGKIHFQKDIKVGVLTQDIKIDSTKSVFDFLKDSNEELSETQRQLDKCNEQVTTRTDYESDSYGELLNDISELNERFNVLEGYQWEEKISNALAGLGFSVDEFHQSLNDFSGGWKMRAELARILVNQPDALLLDEPTNHLDIISIDWLEKYLQKFSGAVVVISHDRLFLDNVTNRTLEIMSGKVFDYPYNYSKYKVQRAEQRTQLISAKKQQEKEIKNTKELIDKYRAKASKAAFAQGLIKKLERTTIIEIEDEDNSKLNVAFPLNVQPGKWVLDLEGVGKTYEKVIFRDVNTVLGRGEKIALLGPNGVGKSTLIKRIMDSIPGEGEVKFGHNVKVTYFAQDEAHQLDVKKTVFETVDEVASGEMRKDIRSILGAFLFSGENVDKRVEVLSGGERTRLALCRLLMSPSNVLILDEPTNHLDLRSKEVLKNALINYEGTFIVVSHDREFLDGLTTKIWEIDDLTLKIHHWGVKEFLAEKLKTPETTNKKVEKKKVEDKPVEEAPKLSYEDAKEQKRLQNKLKNKVSKLEKEVDELESKIKSMDGVLAELDYSDKINSDKKLAEYQKLKDRLDDAILEWEEALEQLEA